MKLSMAFAVVLVTGAAVQAQVRDEEHAWWVTVRTGSECVAVNPRDGSRRTMACAADQVSGDGRTVAYLAQAAGAKGFDLFVADAPARGAAAGEMAGARRVTDGIPGIVQVRWMPDNVTVVFQSTVTGQVYTVRTDGGAARPTQVSDGTGRCYLPTPAANGRIAWFVERSRKGKARFSDLVITRGAGEAKEGVKGGIKAQTFEGAKQGDGAQSVPMPPTVKAEAVKVDVEVAPLPTTTLVKGEDLYAMAFSADGKRLAYGTIGELYLHEFASGRTRTIKLTDVSDRMNAHLVAEVAWRPDGKAVAARFQFAGGRSAGFSPEKPNGPTEMPVLFGDREVFVVPVDAGLKAWWVEGPEGGAGRDGLGWVKAGEAGR